MTGVERIAAERRRQVEVEGWDAEHDDYHHSDGELSLVGAMYAAEAVNRARRRERDAATAAARFGHVQVRVVRPTSSVERFPWDQKHDGRNRLSHLRLLEIAGALIAAEIDRLMRLEGE